MGIIYGAISILGMTAIIGLYLFTLIMRNKGIPKGATLIHGLFAVLGVLLLIVYSLGCETGPWVSIIILLLAALGGLVMNFRDLTGRKVPKWLAVVHGLAAVIGFAYLLVFAFC